MDTRLATLIDDYTQAVRTALTLMKKSGIPLPYTTSEWSRTNLSGIKSLIDGIKYTSHGNGCLVELPDGDVDFDFGQLGEICGFDDWRIANFAKGRHSTYGFATGAELRECFKHAVATKSILPMESQLFRLADRPVENGSCIDTRQAGDLLPLRDRDQVLTLQVHYFHAADLMLEHYDSLLAKWNKTQRLSRDDQSDFRVYMSSWLGFLAVTCEGFRKLKMYLLLNDHRPVEYQELLPECNKLNRAINAHFDSLRKYRNNVFHLRDTAVDTLDFLAPNAGRLGWAKSIHADLKQFFSDYQILCECHYLENERESESEFGPKVH